MTFLLAGQKVRAADLNSGIPQIARVTSDVTVNNSTVQVSVTGLVLPVEANGIYALDGWLYYESNPTADIKFGVTMPASATAVMGFLGVPLTGAPFSAAQVRINYMDTGAFAPGNYSLGGDNEFTGSVWNTALPHGVVTIGATAGNFQVIMAQNTANASNTKVKAGSWIRMMRMG